jgi:glycosyltransferase involved in cell wall biosynthesis
MEVKKVLVFHPALAPYRVDFFNAVHNFFEASFYFSLKNVSDQKFDQENLKSKCNFKCNYLNSGFEFLGRSIRFGVFKIIRLEKPDIIVCAEYGQITLLVFLYNKIFNKSIKVYSMSDDSMDNSIKRSGIRLFLRNVISRNIEGVIFASEEVATWFQQNVSKKVKALSIPIIHSELMLNHVYQESIETANHNIQNYNLAEKKLILFVGRLVEVKNLFFLIKCFSNLKNGDARLVLVGEGDLGLCLKTYAKELGVEQKIIFIGRKETADLYNWYTFSQLFVLTSTYEPFGAVVNEALVGGCFVLCSKLAGASSLINESNGVLFDPYDEIDFTSKLNSALENVKPLKEPIVNLRTNKMFFTFEEKISALFQEL